jgi:hypothetical protein
MHRALVPLVLLVGLAAVAATPSAAKEGGVEARTSTPISREASPGAKVTVVWTLSFLDRYARRPFSAEGVFIRVLGVRSLVDYAGTQQPLGRYRAVIRVPSGGIRALRFGLMGFNSYGPAPMFFPVRGRLFR